MSQALLWKVDTPALLQEIANNAGQSVLRQPLTIFQSILAQVAKRAIELDDKELNKLMIRLGLFEGAHTDEVLAYLET